MSPFQAYLIEQADGQSSGRLVRMDETQLDAGEVTIRVAYSSVNYKDALAATGAGRIIRRFPCVGGIDLSGFVENSSDERFKAGDPVLVTGFDLGVAHHGGYAELARVPADWVIPLPPGLSLADAMALGTAGFTAALAIIRMEENGLLPNHGPVIVTGASGGVGSLAVDMLSSLGYQVTALTGKENQFAYLERLGATQVMLRSALDLSRIRPLDKAQWAGAVDNLGGAVLSWIASTMKPFGTIASIGLAADASFNTTVMPFILRGVSLLGIESGNVGKAYRQRVWQRLCSDLRPPHLQEMTRTVSLAELPETFERFIAGNAHGRVVVQLPSTGLKFG